MKSSPYFQSLDPNEAIQTYLPLVKRIAYQIGSRLPPNVEVDDLIQEGLTGLLDALKRYEPQPGLEFETYARTRIRGAIYDSCRKNDILPRNQRDELEKLEKATRTDIKVRLEIWIIFDKKETPNYFDFKLLFENCPK